MNEDFRVLALPDGDIASRCAAVRSALAQLPPGATLYVSGPSDLPEVLDCVRAPGLPTWHVLAGPVGLEAWTRKEPA